MIRINASLTAFAAAMALLSASSFAKPPGAVTSKEEPLVQKKTAFHVMGLMKSKSGAT